jgi:hypothetical protein
MNEEALAHWGLLQKEKGGGGNLTQAYAKYFGFPRVFLISSRFHIYSFVNWMMENGPLNDNSFTREPVRAPQDVQREAAQTVVLAVNAPREDSRFSLRLN